MDATLLPTIPVSKVSMTTDVNIVESPFVKKNIAFCRCRRYKYIILNDKLFECKSMDDEESNLETRGRGSIYESTIDIIIHGSNITAVINKLGHGQNMKMYVL